MKQTSDVMLISTQRGIRHNDVRHNEAQLYIFFPIEALHKRATY